MGGAPLAAPVPLVSLQDIEHARTVIQGVARRTPMKRSTTLSGLTGATDFHLKLENFQRTGSFKVRGALNKIHSLTPQERARGVVAASAGNHAQGVAFAAAKSGVAAEIFMPEDATLSKVMATRAYGAAVHLAGRDYQEAFEHAQRHQQEHGCIYVHAYDDPKIMAGQGTLGLEIKEEVPDVEAVLVPIGGGGLISGVATALKALDPQVRVIGVQAEGASTIAPSLQKGQPITLERAETMADGIAVRKTSATTLPIIRQVVDEVVTVSENEIAAAILFLLERAKTVVEGAGAVSLAAAMHRKVDLAGQRACAVVSGGNIDMTLLSRIIQRGLIKEGRIAVFDTVVQDRPGQMAAILNLLAQHKANVLDVRHDRNRADVPLHRVGVEVHVETKGPEHVEELRQALAQAGYPMHVRTAKP